jgi:hypothetical protein
VRIRGVPGAAAIAPCALACALVALAPRPAAAHALWLDRSRPRAVMLEYLHADHAEDVSPLGSIDGFSGVFFLTGRAEFTPTMHGVAEISLATSPGNDSPYDLYEEGGALPGSPYLGIEVGRTDAVALFEAGIRVPIANSKPVTTALALGSDLERQSAWYDDAITTRLGVRVRSRPSGVGLWLEARLAPEVLWQMDRTEFDLHATYGATVRIAKPWLRGGVGIGGRAIYEPPDDDDTIEANHMIEGAADFLEGAWRPGLSVRFPFDGNLGETFERTVGLQLTYVW